jgi:hypothetical protein
MEGLMMGQPLLLSSLPDLRVTGLNAAVTIVRDFINAAEKGSS